METETLLIAAVSLASWGIGSFIAKFATNRIGEQSVFWDAVAYSVAIAVYSLVVFKGKTLFSADRTGIVLALLAGLVGSFGLIGFYALLAKEDASRAVPLTAVYPALTAILAFIFLKEKLTVARTVGILLASIAVYLLSL